MQLDPKLTLQLTGASSQALMLAAEEPAQMPSSQLCITAACVGPDLSISSSSEGVHRACTSAH